MTAKGNFVSRGEGSEGHSVFILEGTNLEIDSHSVSSEWTSESDGDESAHRGRRRRAAPADGQAQPRRRVRNWRLRHNVARQGGNSRSSSSGSSSSSDRSGGSSSSSSTSTGSSSTSDGEVARQKRQRRQIAEDWQQPDCPPSGGAGSVGSSGAAAGPELRPDDGCTADPSDPTQPLLAPAAPPDERRGRWALEWFDSPKRYRCFALAPAFLSQEDIRAIQSGARHKTVREINDRKGYLAFKHRVWRFELQLRALQPALYARLMALMDQADAAKWRRLRRGKKKKVYPEVEYIEYDVQKMGEPCFIEPHVDNKSAVSLVAMLSAPEAYVGGASCFRRAGGRDGLRELTLRRGDVVLFRGEKLVHWITPVTAGCREILQIELSRV